jgi:hypothetical protein
MKDEQNNKPEKKWYQKLGAKILAGLGVVALIIAILTGIIDLKKEFKQDKKEDRLEVKKSPIDENSSSAIPTGSGKPIVPVIDSKIKRIVEEARAVKLTSIENTITKFDQAYELLPDTLQNSKFKRSLEYFSFETKAEYLDSFFISLKY